MCVTECVRACLPACVFTGFLSLCLSNVVAVFQSLLLPCFCYLLRNSLVFV